MDSPERVGEQGPAAADEPVTEGIPAAYEAVFARLPERLQRLVTWSLSRWPGRIVSGTASTLIKIEIFDRSMAIAAQFFTSVFPTLIILATWLGRDGTGRVAEMTGMPDQTQNVLDEALASESSTTFALIGFLIVIASATSLSRALTRAMSAIWGLAKPKSRLSSVWRWVAAVLALALSMVGARAVLRLAGDLPPPVFWELVASLALDVVIAVFIPWILLAGKVPGRLLLSGALIFGVVMWFVRPATALWLPRALDVSAERYGSIGVAFTYLAWLYVVSFCFLVAATLGKVIATDEGRVGQFIRGHNPIPGTSTP